ncbi:hypothetical protein [Kitasatospora mediocidica]|uniref:hypothetical protein n=1 Tax=Kitasatospora mediocidica TaxID=58352 RepID=UPI00055E1664|nr:hypothetical protein [Kitasatospora mediocidica]
MTTTAEGIRRAYHVPARVGAQIVVSGRAATIVGFRNGKLRVRYDGDPQIYNAHPVRNTTYLD